MMQVLVTTDRSDFSLTTSVTYHFGGDKAAREMVRKGGVIGAGRWVDEFHYLTVKVRSCAA